MTLYTRITDYIKRESIRTLTLDIFDTVLLRNSWPEDVQFLRVASAWLPYVQRAISSEITAYKLYSWRQYVRDELIRVHYERADQTQHDVEYDVTLMAWFSQLVDVLTDVHQASLTSAQRARLVEQMIAVEIETEKASLSPNTALIDAVRMVKAAHPDLRVYFLSDMYLRRHEIDELLVHFSIDIFDGGSSSTEERKTKHSGGLYHHANNTAVLSESFDLFYNLHIGDNIHADVKMARQAGSHALLYHPYRFRRFRTKVGVLRLKRERWAADKRDKMVLQQAFVRTTKTPLYAWQQFGILFLQPLHTFLLHVGLSARQTPETTFLMVSSEATSFLRLGKRAFPRLFAAKNIAIAPKLNRRMMLRALVWFLATHRDKMINSTVIFRTICLGEVSGTRREIYEFFFDGTFPYSELVLERRSEKDFVRGFLADVRAANEKHTRALSEAYDYVYTLLPRADERLVIVDVGWGGTVQVLFSEFAKLHGNEHDIEGLYLGVHPFHRFGIRTPRATGYLLPNVLSAHDRGLWNSIIWEYAYTNKPQFPEDYARLEQIQAGFSKGEALFCHLEHNPKMSFDRYIAPRIRRLISRPTRREVETIGSIRFDQGFVDEHEFRIVDTSRSQLAMWRRLARHPRSTIRSTVLMPNAWGSGYVQYYRMYGVRLFLRLAGKVRRRHYL